MGRKRKNPDSDYYNRRGDLPGIGHGRFLRAAGKTGSDEEQEAELLFEVRRKAILDEARRNGIGFDLSDCFAKDLDALEAKLVASPLSAAKAEPSTKKQREVKTQGEVSEAFCQAHFARLVDLAQAGPVTIVREDEPLLVVLSPERYAALLDGRPAT